VSFRHKIFNLVGMQLGQWFPNRFTFVPNAHAGAGVFGGPLDGATVIVDPSDGRVAISDLGQSPTPFDFETDAAGVTLTITRQLGGEVFEDRYELNPDHGWEYVPPDLI
jgi:hypothetical protein